MGWFCGEKLAELCSAGQARASVPTWFLALHALFRVLILYDFPAFHYELHLL
jgi:hypothetical protein